MTTERKAQGMKDKGDDAAGDEKPGDAMTDDPFK